MRVLVCASEFPPDYSSGIGNMVYNVSKEFSKLGVDHTIVTPMGPDVYAGNIRLIERLGILGLLHQWREMGKVISKCEDYDAVWLHNPLLLGKLPSIRLLSTIHSTYYGELKRRVAPMVYKRGAAVIEKMTISNIACQSQFTAVSNEVAGELKSICPSLRRPKVIGNGVDVNVFKPSTKKSILRRSFGLPEDRPVALCVGRLTDTKRPLSVISLFSKLKNQDVIVVFAGDGNLRRRSEIASMTNMPGRAVFLGRIDYVHQMPVLLSCADYFVMASKYEGVPLSLLEAMASGLPCIVSESRGLEIVKVAKCGITVNYDNIEEAADKVDDYISSCQHEDSLRARDYAVKNLSWSEVARKYRDELMRG